jgi:hypothetical protein
MESVSVAKSNHRTLVHEDCGGPTRAGSVAEPECPNLVWTELESLHCVARGFGFALGLECIRPATVLVDDLVDFSHDPDGVAQGDNNLVVVSDVVR